MTSDSDENFALVEINNQYIDLHNYWHGDIPSQEIYLLLRRCYEQGRIAGLKEAINICDCPEFTEGLIIAKDIRTKIQELEKRG